MKSKQNKNNERQDTENDCHKWDGELKEMGERGSMVEKHYFVGGSR